jgi:hypothetical protein
LEVDGDAIIGERAVDDLRDPRRQPFPVLQPENAPLAVIESEADVGPRHRQAPDHIEAGGILAARRAQELAARRDLGEQVLDPNPRSRRQRGGPFGRERPVIDHARPALLRAPHAALERQPRDAGDRRQRLAAKAQRGDLLDRLVRQLGRRMPLERERDFLGGHAASVVGHFDPCESAIFDLDRDPRRAGVDCVLDQFLERGGRPLDHFARGNTVDQRLRQAANCRH